MGRLRRSDWMRPVFEFFGRWDTLQKGLARVPEALVGSTGLFFKSRTQHLDQALAAGKDFTARQCQSGVFRIVADVIFEG